MRIAVFDHHIVATNPIGGCHRLLLEHLCADHEFTVFAAEFDNPDPDRIEWVRVPTPPRPLALLFAGYHVMAPLCYLAHRFRGGARFDLVQMVEGNLSFGDLSYSQFCHRRFLRQLPAGAGGLRGRLRRLDHRLRAAGERAMCRRVRNVVVPSAGLAGELAVEYPGCAEVTVIPNAVQGSRLARPADFDRRAQRRRLRIGDDDLVVAFVALGHFERKGLPFLLAALHRLGQPGIKLVVVGGPLDLVRVWSRRAARAGVAEAVRFVGMQDDVRPFLWASDVFALPSSYETFSLATWEAAASGLALLVTRHHGTEGVVDGEHGRIVEPTVAGVAEGLADLASRPTAERRRMGARAGELARDYELESFLKGWSELYARLSPPAERTHQALDDRPPTRTRGFGFRKLYLTSWSASGDSGCPVSCGLGGCMTVTGRRSRPAARIRPPTPR